MTMTTRMLQLQATVKRFQIDLHLDLEGQHTLISLIFKNKPFRTDEMNQTAQRMVKSWIFHIFGVIMCSYIDQGSLV